MIPWWYAVIALVVGAFIGLIVAGLMNTADDE